MIAFKLLDSWGFDGFKAHTERVSEFYRAKRDVFERAMHTHLGGLAEWTTPEAGMFFWCVSTRVDPKTRRGVNVSLWIGSNYCWTLPRKVIRNPSFAKRRSTVAF